MAVGERKKKSFTPKRTKAVRAGKAAKWSPSILQDSLKGERMVKKGN